MNCKCQLIACLEVTINQLVAKLLKFEKTFRSTRTQGFVAVALARATTAPGLAQSRRATEFSIIYAV